MDTVYNTNIIVHLTPIHWRQVPIVSYGVDDCQLGEIILYQSTNLIFNQNLTSGSHKIWIDFFNKDYTDCCLEKNLDMAVEISRVTIEGMTYDRFRWAGEYRPDYPEEYPVKTPVIESATYLGWNGRWELPFTTPIFTWIHRLENLGWLYEP